MLNKTGELTTDRNIAKKNICINANKLLKHKAVSITIYPNAHTLYQWYIMLLHLISIHKKMARVYTKIYK